MHRLEQAPSVIRVDVRRGRLAQAADQLRRKVAQDVAEHVGGDDHVEAARVLHQLHRRGIDKEMLGLEVGRGLPLDRKDPLPEVMRVIECVALVDHGDPSLMARRSPLACQPKSVVDDALDPLAGVDVLLDRDLVGRAPLELTTNADVGAFGILAHDDQVDGSGIAQWRQPGRQQPRRAQVDPEVQLETQAQQQTSGILRVFDSRVADSAQVDGIDQLQLAEHRVGQDLPSAQVAIRAQVIGDEIQVGPGCGCDRLQDPDSLGDDLGANAVARDDGDPKRHWLQHSRHEFRKVSAHSGDTTT